MIRTVEQVLVIKRPPLERHSQSAIHSAIYKNKCFKCLTICKWRAWAHKWGSRVVVYSVALKSGVASRKARAIFYSTVPRRLLTPKMFVLNFLSSPFEHFIYTHKSNPTREAEAYLLAKKSLAIISATIWTTPSLARKTLDETLRKLAKLEYHLYIYIYTTLRSL